MWSGLGSSRLVIEDPSCKPHPHYSTTTTVSYKRLGCMIVAALSVGGLPVVGRVAGGEVGIRSSVR